MLIKNNCQVAILGATSHIAKGLIYNFLAEGDSRLHLFTMSPDKVKRFLLSIKEINGKNYILHEGYTKFMECTFDVVINCVGVGTSHKLQDNYTKYFTVTEEYDNLAINYLLNCSPNTLYISFSSGAVYGSEFSSPVEENSVNNIMVNHISKTSYYSIVRLNAEAKHRAFNNMKIVDLRIFSYFSRFADLTDGYFISEVLDCILNKKVLITDNVNIIRDYIHPEDLFSIINKCMDADKINTAFDVNSTKPIKKKEILDYFSLEYGLKYEMSRHLSNVSATGSKNIYCSNYMNAAGIGYKPVFSSMDALKEESKYILLI